jgi:hypothetical protein
MTVGVAPPTHHPYVPFCELVKLKAPVEVLIEEGVPNIPNVPVLTDPTPTKLGKAFT